MGEHNQIEAGKMIQAAYVTTDIERAVDLFAGQFSIKKFLRVGPATVDFGLGKSGTLKVALAYWRDFQYEIIEPVSGDVDLYADAINPELPVTFHHFAYALPSREGLDGLSAHLRQSRDICITGEWGENSAYFYTDTRADLGHYTEYFYAEPDYDALIPRH